jgi:hypothetical protein
MAQHGGYSITRRDSCWLKGCVVMAGIFVFLFAFLLISWQITDGDPSSGTADHKVASAENEPRQPPESKRCNVKLKRH